MPRSRVGVDLKTISYNRSFARCRVSWLLTGANARCRVSWLLTGANARCRVSWLLAGAKWSRLV
jgi:hypothetical protein